MTTEEFDRDHLCFVCGKQNAAGLQLEPEAADGRAILRWTPAPEYQGYAGVLHGGMISTLMDEAMAHAALSLARSAPTVEITVEFLKPVATGIPLEVEARVVERRRRILDVEAELTQEGEIRARSRGRFLARTSTAPAI